MTDMPSRISMTPTVARQTQKAEFGNVLKDALTTAAQGASSLLGGVIPGVGVVSAAVNSVAGMSKPGAVSAQSAASGITSVNLGGSASSGIVGGNAGGATETAMATSNGNIGGMGDMIGQMRAEADRSMAMQMQMQQESRDYNTLSNVLKTRHDSAKAAINNIR
jgi:hypothetical protein